MVGGIKLTDTVGPIDLWANNNKPWASWTIYGNIWVIRNIVI